MNIQYFVPKRIGIFFVSFNTVSNYMKRYLILRCQTMVGKVEFSNNVIIACDELGKRDMALLVARYIAKQIEKKMAEEWIRPRILFYTATFRTDVAIVLFEVGGETYKAIYSVEGVGTSTVEAKLEELVHAET